MTMFRLVVLEHLELSKKRLELKKQAHHLLKDNRDYQVLRTLSGVGPIVALTIAAEAGDLRRFGHERQFLKYCGLALPPSNRSLFAAPPSCPSAAMRVWQCVLDCSDRGCAHERKFVPAQGVCRQLKSETKRL